MYNKIIKTKTLFRKMLKKMVYQLYITLTACALFLFGQFSIRA